MRSCSFFAAVEYFLCQSRKKFFSATRIFSNTVNDFDHCLHTGRSDSRTDRTRPDTPSPSAERTRRGAEPTSRHRHPRLARVGMPTSPISTHIDRQHGGTRLLSDAKTLCTAGRRKAAAHTWTCDMCSDSVLDYMYAWDEPESCFRGRTLRQLIRWRACVWLPLWVA